MSLVNKIRTIQDVVEWGLCAGCGICVYACRHKKQVSLINVENVGNRPLFRGDCGECTDCLSVCPGYSIYRPTPVATAQEELKEEGLGAAIEIWEGHAADTQMRRCASSGGVVSALAAYCLEREGMTLALHTGNVPQKPWMNCSAVSKTRAEILARAGSRYAPSSPCADLEALEQCETAGVFIGKPCDTSAVSAMRKIRPALDVKIGLTVAIFCAGTPCTRGALDLIHSFGADSRRVTRLQYRGDGWPGRFQVTCADGEPILSLSYADSWDWLGKYRPLSCSLCPDGMGSLADISCGDAWDQYEDQEKNEGLSIVIVRTARGREVLHRAMEAGYVCLVPSGAAAVFAAQPHLVSKRQEVFGRLLALRLLLAPIPRFSGFSLFRGWLKLPIRRKIRSVTGTLLRGVRRGWWKRRHFAVKETS